MWGRLGEVCEALADADEAGRLALWRELTQGEVLERACRAALADERALPTLARCQELLADKGLPDRLAPFVEQIRKWDFHEAESVVREARQEVEGAILASLALRCAAGEPVGRELLSWASRFCIYFKPADGDLAPAQPDRPVSWIEACIPPLWRANPARIKSNGPDRLKIHLRWDLRPAFRRLQRHDLDAILRGGANATEVSALQRLLDCRPLADVRDLSAVLTGEGEVRFDAGEGYLLPVECASSLPGLIASADVRVRLLALIVTGNVLEDFEPGEYDSEPRPPMPAKLPDVLNAARADAHSVVASLALCAAGQLAHPEVPLALVVERLWDTRPVVRAAAVRAVARMEGGATSADALAPLLADPAASVRLAAADAVGRLGGPALSPAVRTCLLPLLDDADFEVRREAIWAAGALGTAMTEAMVVRLTAMKAEEGELIRMASVEALGAAGQLARRPAVYSALAAQIDDPHVCEEAWKAYADLDGPADADLLRRVAMVRDRTISGHRRQAAVDFLERIISPR